MHKSSCWCKRYTDRTWYLGLCLHMRSLQASLRVQKFWLGLSYRASVFHRAALVRRAASNFGAIWPVCLQLHHEPAHARQHQKTNNRGQREGALAKAEIPICSQQQTSTYD